MKTPVFPGLDKISLAIGEHKKRAGCLNIMEAAAWFAGEKHTSEPFSVCPVVAAFVWRFSDDMLFEDRNNLLKPLIPLICQTRKDGELVVASERRSQMRLRLLFQWGTGEVFSSWLDAAAEHNSVLRERFDPALRYYSSLNQRSFEFIRDQHEPVFKTKIGLSDVPRLVPEHLKLLHASGCVAACWALASKGGSYLRDHATNVETNAYHFVGACSSEAVRRVSEKLQKGAIELIKKMCELQ